ncbi:hypothetical protein [Afifella sp. IM 167]|uniref:hypothetical protein n=1 Tax=Afifella sp. IM 167 TaxID=2033586 RepID=UPI001CCE1B56|nr:hypothetical protein [Afifella sp. IM 167]MBZ8134163.1 hypothetical protein [Afifella sp. IM 167]
MTFPEAVWSLPPLIRWWVVWLGVITTISGMALLFARATRKDGLILLAVAVAVATWMSVLYAEHGMVRLLALPHVVLWTPLLVWIVWRLGKGAYPAPYRQLVVVLAVSLFVSLLFDYADLVRWLMGDRAPMVAPDGPDVSWHRVAALVPPAR